jgi:hypothetical protein
MTILIALTPSLQRSSIDRSIKLQRSHPSADLRNSVALRKRTYPRLGDSSNHPTGMLMHEPHSFDSGIWRRSAIPCVKGVAKSNTSSSSVGAFPNLYNYKPERSTIRLQQKIAKLNLIYSLPIAAAKVEISCLFNGDRLLSGRIAY